MLPYHYKFASLVLSRIMPRANHVRRWTNVSFYGTICEESIMKGVEPMPAPIAWNRSPLTPSAFAPLPLSAIIPKGWLQEAIAASAPKAMDERLIAAYLLGGDKAILEAEQPIEALMSREDALNAEAVRGLMAFHGATADGRVLRRMLRAAKALRERLQKEPLPPRRAADIGDMLHGALWLYNLTGQKGLLNFCKALKSQAPDWMSTFHVFPQTKEVTEAPSPETDAYARLHGATLAAALKTPALQALFEGGYKNETAFAVGWDKLLRHHGAAHGLFNADPLLAGGNPSRGVEASVVSELMRTLSVLQWANGAPFVGDLMEEIAYNALPAAKGVQSANQIVPRQGESADGIAQFAASLLTASSDGGLAVWGYAPCEARWLISGQTVRLVMETDYPHGEVIRMQIRLKEPARFPLRLRIPTWANGATLSICDEEPYCAKFGAFERVEREWRDNDTVTLTLPMEPRLLRWYHQSASVRVGPLALAFPVGEDVPWNWALLPDLGMAVLRDKGTTSVKAFAASVPDWRLSGDVPAPLPILPAVEGVSTREIVLIPYGETLARIGQFPIGVIKERT